MDDIPKAVKTCFKKHASAPRRSRDIDKSGWWMLLWLIPVLRCPRPNSCRASGEVSRYCVPGPSLFVNTTSRQNEKFHTKTIPI